MLRLFILSCIIKCSIGEHLPDYLKPCSLSDKQFEECAIKNGNEALSSILKGDTKFKVPNMMPLIVPQVNVEAGNLKIEFKDIHTDSLSHLILTKFKINEAAKEILLTAIADSLEFAANYEINGQILILPINGKGRANVTYADAAYNYKMHYKIVEKGGKEYINIVDSRIDFVPKRGYFTFENLFNGDKRLGEEMNKFIDENWQEFSKEIYPAVQEAINLVVSRVFGSYLSRVPKDEIFLP